MGKKGEPSTVTTLGARVSAPVQTGHPSPGSQTAKIDAVGLDGLCRMLEFDELSLVSAARKIGVSPATLSAWVEAGTERTSRIREARARSAATCEALAREALLAIDDAGQTGQIARQRELASHYRWMAKTRNPREFGDKVAIEQEVVQLTPEQVQQRIDRLKDKA